SRAGHSTRMSTQSAQAIAPCAVALSHAGVMYSAYIAVAPSISSASLHALSSVVFVRQDEWRLTMRLRSAVRCVLASAALLSTPTLAANVSWTDWLTAPNTSSASGEITVGSESITVDYSGTGNHAFVQTGTGTNFWTGTAYTNGIVDNAPPAAELVALSQGGLVTITLSQPVQNPLIGLVSWNGNTVEFGVPIEIDSFGPGFWGNGTPLLNAAGTGFVGSGEVHGVI